MWSRLYQEYPGLARRLEDVLKDDSIYPCEKAEYDYLKVAIMLAKIHGKLPADVLIKQIYVELRLKEDLDDFCRNLIPTLMAFIRKEGDADIIMEEDFDLYRFIRNVANRL